MKRVEYIVLRAVGLVFIIFLIHSSLQSGKNYNKSDSEFMAKKNLTESNQTFNVGGKSIIVTSPGNVYSEVGAENRKYLDVFVPSVNRLVCGFLLTTDLPILIKGDTGFLKSYAIVEILREAEYMNIDATDFKQFVDYLKSSKRNINSSFRDAVDEINEKLKSIDETVQIGKPLQLGTFFSKPEAYSFGMIAKYTQDNKSQNVAMSCTMLHLKQRLFYFYYYMNYVDASTIQLLGSNTEKWIDAVIKANK